MPRPTPRAAPKARPSRPSPKPRPRTPKARATAPAQPTPTAPAPTPPTFAERVPAGIFRVRLPAEKAFRPFSVRVSQRERELYELARTCPGLLDHPDEELPTSEALRRLAYLGAVSLGLVSATAAPA